jgi:hypothetical protein
MIESIIAGIISSSVYNHLENVLSISEDELKKIITIAIENSIDKFYEKYGHRYTQTHDTFLAREENWELLLKSFFYSNDLYTTDSINRKGFKNEHDATDEEVEYFLNQFYFEIKTNHQLDKIITEKTFMSRVLSSQNLILSKLDSTKNTAISESTIQRKNSSEINFLISLNEKFEIKDKEKLKLTLDEFFHALHQGSEQTIKFEIDMYSDVMRAIQIEKAKENPNRKKLLEFREGANLFWIAGKEPEYFLNDLIRESISNFYRNPNRIRLNINELSIVVLNCFKMIRTNIASEHGTKFDIFHFKNKGWYCSIYLSHKELSALMDKHEVKAPQILTKNFGLDLYDLTQATRVQKVIPSLIFEYLRFKYNESLEIPDSSQFFSLFNWKMGLG